jgi:formylglycine-generating enzyme required for sulfatase activity
MPRYEELSTIDGWVAATPTTRATIAAEIARDHGLELETIAPFRRVDLPLASFRGLDGLFRFVLVPGGTCTMGLSTRELETLEALAARHRDEPAFGQTWARLLAPDNPLRVLREVPVRPVLFAQNALADVNPRAWRKEMGDLLVGERGDLEALPEGLEAGLRQFGYRLPREHEWEWCARGGRRGELTFLGDVLPDAAHLRGIRRGMEKSEGPDDGDRHASLANDLGLLGFGVAAEVCVDAFRPTSGDHVVPLADRVVRGGAGATWPWQNAGEWFGLLSAHRQRCGGLEVAIGVRPVRDVEG